MSNIRTTSGAVSAALKMGEGGLRPSSRNGSRQAGKPSCKFKRNIYHSTTMQGETYSMNVSDMTEDEIDEAVSDALHGIVKAMDLRQEKKSFRQEVTNALFNILKRRDLTIFDVLIKRDEKVCEILDEQTKDTIEGRVLEGPIDTETVKVYNLRSKDPDGSFELLYDNEFRKNIHMTLYTKQKRIKM